MILLWGVSTDGPLTAVYDVLRRAGCSVTMLDQMSVLDTDVELSVGSCVDGRLRIGHQESDLSAVTALYLRPYDSRRVPVIARAGLNSPEWRHAIAVEDLLSSWADLTSALVVNRPTAMAMNGSKPCQATRIEALGFRVPDTLVTTDPYAAMEFWKCHGRVIYKSLSGIRSIVSRLGPEHESRLKDVVSCPTLFQEYVPGSDCRVHVVGSDLFACRIVCEADDYRYASSSGHGVQIEPYDLAEEIATRCRALTASMNLIVAGIDLRYSDGAWYCFEVNPSPAFTYYQAQTRQPISESIARLLMSGHDELAGYVA